MLTARWRRVGSASLLVALAALAFACTPRMERGERPVAFELAELGVTHVGLEAVGWSTERVEATTRAELAKRWGWETPPRNDATPLRLDLEVYAFSEAQRVELALLLMATPQDEARPSFRTQVAVFVDRAEWARAPDDAIRATVAQGLAYIDGMAGMLYGSDEDLERHLFVSSYTQAAGLHEMHRRGWDGAFDSAIDALFVGDAIVRQAAIEVLERHGDPEAIEYIAQSMAKDEENLERSLDAIERIAPNERDDVLQRIAAAHPSAEAREAAQRRLAPMTLEGAP